MKRLLMFMIVNALLVGISCGVVGERFTFSNLTAKDKRTGLMWTRDANIPGRWMSWNEANDYINQLNKQKYSGYTDWRLPSKEELETLIDYAKGSITDFPHQLLNKVGFKNVRAESYWSSSTQTFTTLPTCAWFVQIHDGGVGCSHTGTSFVWPVRGRK